MQIKDWCLWTESEGFVNETSSPMDLYLIGLRWGGHLERGSWGGGCLCAGLLLLWRRRCCWRVFVRWAETRSVASACRPLGFAFNRVGWGNPMSNSTANSDWSTNLLAIIISLPFNILIWIIELQWRNFWEMISMMMLMLNGHTGPSLMVLFSQPKDTTT